MSEKLGYINFLNTSGKREEALKEFEAYNGNMRKCLEMISDTTVPLFNEMTKWVKKFSMCCDLLDAIYNAKKAPSAESLTALCQETEKYNSDGVILTGFCLREMAEKTIKNLKECWK